MKVLNPTLTTHTIRVVPRYYPTGVVEVVIDEVDIPCTYLEVDGYLDVTFDYTITDKTRNSFYIKEGSEIVYRGKLYSTESDTQNYKQSLDLYEY